MTTELELIDVDIELLWEQLQSQKYCFYCGHVVELDTDYITEKIFPINPDDRSYHECLPKQMVLGYYGEFLTSQKFESEKFTK
jgi:hypothetical protein